MSKHSKSQRIQTNQVWLVDWDEGQKQVLYRPDNIDSSYIYRGPSHGFLVLSVPKNVQEAVQLCWEANQKG